MTFCNNCGKPPAPGLRFCSGCGAAAALGPPSLARRFLAALARFRAAAERLIKSIPGYAAVEKVASVLTAPIRGLSRLTLTICPPLRKLEYILEIESLSKRNPIILSIPLIALFLMGLRTTELGHIGTAPGLYSTMAVIGVFNPFLGIFCAVCFGIGDLLQKILIENDIYGARDGRDMNFWGACLGYCVAYSAVALAAVSPGVMSRLARLPLNLLIGRLVKRAALRRAQGGEAAGGTLAELAQLGATMAGAYVGARMALWAAPTIEEPAFMWRPDPDVSCHKLEADSIIPQQAHTAGVAGATGGTAATGLVGPGTPPVVPPPPPEYDGEGGDRGGDDAPPDDGGGDGSVILEGPDAIDTLIQRGARTIPNPDPTQPPLVVAGDIPPGVAGGGWHPRVVKDPTTGKDVTVIDPTKPVVIVADATPKPLPVDSDAPPPDKDVPTKDQPPPDQEAPPKDKAPADKDAPPKDQAPADKDAPPEDKPPPDKEAPPEDKAPSDKDTPPKDEQPTPTGPAILGVTPTTTTPPDKPGMSDADKAVRRKQLQDQIKQSEEEAEREKGKSWWFGAGEKIFSAVGAVADFGVDALEKVTGPAGKVVKSGYLVVKGAGTSASEAWWDGKSVGDAALKGAGKGAVDAVIDIATGKALDAVGPLTKIPILRNIPDPVKGKLGNVDMHNAPADVVAKLLKSAGDFPAATDALRKRAGWVGADLARDKLLKGPFVDEPLGGAIKNKLGLGG